jgi:UDP-glucose 4-epimerase
MILVTGASGHIGSSLCSLLRTAGHAVLAVDIHPSSQKRVEACDIRARDQVAALFDAGPIHTVIHLAAILPTAFHADPVAAAEVNVTGSLNLLREATRHRGARFVFGSSMSVYGSSNASRALSERDPPVPDEPYGAAKRMVELAAENLAATSGLDFVSLRIARVVGPGARLTASSWRSEIFEGADSSEERCISIPFAPSTKLSLVHVAEVARMLMVLAEAAELPQRIYNSPAEVWETEALAELVERARAICVQMGEAHGGPICDGSLFTQTFGFRLKGLAEFFSLASYANR